MSALKDFRSYCDDTRRSVEQRFNMDTGTRIEIESRLHAERAWVQKDRSKLFAGRHEIEKRKNELVCFIERIGAPSTHELNMDKLDADHRCALRHCFECLAPVAVTDPSTGTVVIGRIDNTIRSTRLGLESEPDWVCIKGTWYRDKEVRTERTKDVDDYQSSELEFGCGTGSLMDLTDCEVSDAEIDNGKLPLHRSNILHVPSVPTVSLFADGNGHERREEEEEEVGLNNNI